MKTVLVNGRFLTRRVTGVERYARELLAALGQIPNLPFQVVIAVPAGELLGPLPIFPVRQDGSALKGALWDQIRLPILFRRWGVDLLWSPCNVGSVALRRQVVTLHDASVFAGPEWFSPAFGFYYRWMFRCLGGRVLRVLTDSIFSRNELIRYGVASAERIAVVPAGITPLRTAGRLSDPFLLSLSSRDPRKNVKRLVSSWRRLPVSARLGCRLVIAGGGGKAFRGEEDLSAEGVDVLGYVSDTRLEALYVGARGFVYPSLYEGFGLPPLEAMARGVPVLVSNIEPLKELCGDAALYCDPLDEADISAKMARLIGDDALREDLRGKGPARASDFSWNKAASSLARELSAVLGFLESLEPQRMRAGGRA